MAEGINKLFGVIPEGGRKLTVLIFLSVALVLMHLLGEATAQESIAGLWKIGGLYFGGNGLEHIGKGLAKLPAKNGDTTVNNASGAPPVGSSGTGSEGGSSKILLLFVILAIAVMASVLFPMKAKAGVLDYIDPQLGSGWEFLQVKGPVATGTARIFQGKENLDWLSVRLGGLIGESAKPGLIAGPFVDLDLVTRGKVDFLLGKVKADVGIFGGAFYTPGEEVDSKLEGLVGVGVTLVAR
jgi:hypothetical protein